MPATNGLPWYKVDATEEVVGEDLCHLTAEELGVYHLIRCHCWREGSVTSDRRRLASLCRTTRDRLPEILEALEGLVVPSTDDEDRLVAPAVTAQLEKAKRISKARAEAGRAGGHAKAGTKPPPNDGASKCQASASKCQANSGRQEIGECRSEIGEERSRSQTTTTPSGGQAPLAFGPTVALRGGGGGVRRKPEITPELRAWASEILEEWDPGPKDWGTLQGWFEESRCATSIAKLIRKKSVDGQGAPIQFLAYYQHDVEAEVPRVRYASPEEVAAATAAAKARKDEERQYREAQAREWEAQPAEWLEIVTEMQADPEVDAEEFSTWVRPARCVQVADGGIHLVFPNEHFVYTFPRSGVGQQAQELAEARGLRIALPEPRQAVGS